MTDRLANRPPIYTTENYTPVSNVGRSLIDAATLFAGAIDHGAKEVGISGPQWVVLMRIASGVGSSAAELCRRIGYDSGSMTRMLDRLVGLGLIRRDRSDDDRRVVRLSLTDAGQAMYPRLRPIAIEVLNRHLDGFTPAEVDQLMDFLHRIVKNNGTK